MEMNGSTAATLPVAPDLHPRLARSTWILLALNFTGKAGAAAIFPVSWPTALALWFLPDALIAYHLFFPGAQGLVRSCRFFKTTRREVWLTIDDGPDPADTPSILELLKSHQARATFFVIGKNAAAHPELIRAIVAEGHEIGYHTDTHPAGSFWCASPSRLDRELDDGLQVLGRMAVFPTRFRPPVGIKNLWLAPALAKRHLVCIGWSARGLESRSVSSEIVVARVLSGLRPGSILLLHEGPAVPPELRVDVIGKTLRELRDAGYSCVVPPADKISVSN